MGEDAKRTVIARHFAKRQEKRIVEVPFLVASDVEEVGVELRVSPTQGHATVDLGLRDVHGVRGWSGGARQVVWVGEETASPGYVAGPLPAGEWAVLLGLYEVPDAGVSVEIAMEMRLKAPRWLRGDFHAHSIHSDGAFSLTEALDKAEEQGLDFLALTDHNTVSQNLNVPRDARVLGIPGMEFTTYDGHANFIGAVYPIDDFRAASREDVYRLMRTAAERGAVVSLNHPFESSCPSCAWRWGMEAPADAVEVWNGPWRPDNERALRWWHQALLSGRRLVAIGGSDVHNLENPYVRHGHPCTWVYSPARRTADILTAVRQGHVFITADPDGPRIEVECGSYRMGDRVPRHVTDATTIRVREVEAGDEVRIIPGVGDVLRWRAQSPGEYVCEVQEPRPPFLRVEVWRWSPTFQTEVLVALSNPLYFELGDLA
ncbi:MAG: CehA/McbA family metallohydrolase [Firmicutes bacterium]|nr:CehA/McbA family metallohydrolase [Bacillota bacterium]